MTLQWFENLKAQFDLNFIQRNRWRFITTGLGNTLLAVNHAQQAVNMEPDNFEIGRAHV